METLPVNVKLPKTLTRIEISGRGITALLEIHSTREELGPRRIAGERKGGTPAPAHQSPEPESGSRPAGLPRSPTELARLESEGVFSLGVSG
jgi:hypothetical protein